MCGADIDLVTGLFVALFLLLAACMLLLLLATGILMVLDMLGFIDMDAMRKRRRFRRQLRHMEELGGDHA